MKFVDVIRRAARSLRTAKVRTFLTAAAIGVGAFTLALTLAAGNGVRDYTTTLISSNYDPSELLVGRDRELTNSGTPSGSPQEYDSSVGSLAIGGSGDSIQVKQVTAEDVAEIRSQPYIEQVREELRLSIRYITREGQKKYTGSAEMYNSGQKPPTVAGSLPQTGDIKQGTILLPESYVQPLGFGSPEKALGQTIQIAVEAPFTEERLAALQSNFASGALSNASADSQLKVYSYTVGAVVKPAATSLSFGVMPISMNAQDAREIYDYTTKDTATYDKYVYVYARVKDGANEENLIQAKEKLAELGYTVQTSQDLQKTITQFVDILQIMVGVFGLITVIASVFGIVNTQYISVLERTREIGLMKALGMRRRDVNRLFMLEATWIGTLGGLSGVLAALVAGAFANPAISSALNLEEGQNLLIFQPTQLAGLVIALALVATFAGLLPARKAAKLDPIEALRTE